MIALTLTSLAWAQEEPAPIATVEPAPVSDEADEPIDEDAEPSTEEEPTVEAEPAETEPEAEAEAEAEAEEEASETEEVVTITDRTPRSAPTEDRRIVTIGFDLGHQYTDQPDYDLFPGNAFMLALGARAQVKLLENLQVVGTWARSQRGADYQFATEDYTSFPFVRGALTVDQFALGPRVEVEIADVVRPYVLAQALWWRGQIRMDDDLDTTNNPNQIRETAQALGLTALAGLEIRVPDQPVAFYAEFGHRWVAEASFDDLGTIQPRGYLQRLGIALRF